MYPPCFRPLQHWDCGFESHLKDCLCVRLFCVGSGHAASWSLVQRSPTVCVKNITKLKKRPWPSKGLQSHWWMNEWNMSSREIVLLWSTSRNWRVPLAALTHVSEGLVLTLLLTIKWRSSIEVLSTRRLTETMREWPSSFPLKHSKEIGHQDSVIWNKLF
jgi:hypothetical protein